MPCDQNSKYTSPNEWSKVNNDLFVKEPPTNLQGITKDNLLDKIELKKLKDENRFLQAGLCAILTELEKANTINPIIYLASDNGKINLLDFWKNHKQTDVQRLQKELDKFSRHEKEILKSLLD